MNIKDLKIKLASIVDGLITLAKINTTGATTGDVPTFDGTNVVWDAPAGGLTLALTIDADDTNESLRVQVTGNASETWTWLVELELLDLRIS